MKQKITIGLVFILFCYFGYEIDLYVNYQSELRQLNKQKLRLEIQLLKIQIEINEINLQKEY